MRPAGPSWKRKNNAVVAMPKLLRCKKELERQNSSKSKHVLFKNKHNLLPANIQNLIGI